MLTLSEYRYLGSTLVLTTVPMGLTTLSYHSLTRRACLKVNTCRYLVSSQTQVVAPNTKYHSKLSHVMICYEEISNEAATLTRNSI
jgi:hypothetical protein